MTKAMEAIMDQFVDWDVSQEQTHVCVVGADGNIVWQGKCGRPRMRCQGCQSKAPHAVRVALESGPLSTWHWHALTAKEFRIVCLDARHAKAALSMQINKTDKNDAYGLAQIVSRWYREVAVRALDSHALRSMLGTRYNLSACRQCQQPDPGRAAPPRAELPAETASSHTPPPVPS